MNYSLLDFVGNVGVLILMVAYLLLQLNKLNNGLAYSALIANFNLSAFLMEVFWVLISFVGIFRNLRPKPVQT